MGVAASRPDRAAGAARALGAEGWFDTAEELVTSPDVDVVHICTPNFLHLPLATAALEAGKHVVCEKPLSPDVAGAMDMVRVAEEAGTVATVPFVYRFYATVREAKARLETGDLGDLHLIHGSYLQDWLLSPDDSNWRVDASLGGASRAFADIGSHWCDLVEFVSGHRITHVTAQMHTAYPTRTFTEHQEAFATGGGGEQRAVDTEDAAVVMFRTDGGAVGSVVVSQISSGRKNRLWFEIDGSDAAVAFDQENAETLWWGERDRVSILNRAPEHLSKAAATFATLPGGHPLGYHDCFDLFIAQTYEAIVNGIPEGLPSFADGLRAARVADAVVRSARENKTVEVAT